VGCRPSNGDGAPFYPEISADLKEPVETRAAQPPDEVGVRALEDWSAGRGLRGGVLKL
jgi:hypothetical protein